MQRQVVSPTVDVPQIRFIARVSGHSCCATETGTQFSTVAVMAAMKGFFQAIFRAPPGRLELSASFLEPSMVKSSLPSRAPLHNSSDSVDIDIVPSWSRLKKKQQQQQQHSVANVVGIAASCLCVLGAGASQDP